MNHQEKKIITLKSLLSTQLDIPVNKISVCYYIHELLMTTDLKTQMPIICLLGINKNHGYFGQRNIVILGSVGIIQQQILSL